MYVCMCVCVCLRCELPVYCTVVYCIYCEWC